MHLEVLHFVQELKVRVGMKEDESSITRQCWSLLNVYFAFRNVDFCNCLFLVLSNCFCGKRQIFLQ